MDEEAGLRLDDIDFVEEGQWPHRSAASIAQDVLDEDFQGTSKKKKTARSTRSTARG